MNRRRSANHQINWSVHPLGISFVTLAAVLTVFLALAISSASQAELVISEVLADPNQDWDGDGTVDFRNDEWVEVLNTGTEGVDLSIYWLRDESAYDPDVRLWGFLEPGQVAVFYGSEVVLWQEDNGLSGTGFALNNGGDQVFLLKEHPGQTWDEFEEVDSVLIPNHMADNDRSGGLSTDGDTWILYDYLMPYSGSALPGGTNCPPSPGALNHCPAYVPNEIETLGGVKAIYR